MKTFLKNVRDAVEYSLSDWRVFLIIGAILFIVSVNRKYTRTNYGPMDIINLLMIIPVGYGSYISWYTLNYRDYLPDISNVRAMAWEGLKKSFILAIYTAVLTYLMHHATLFYASGSFPLAVVCFAVFAVVYMMLIGGLINRYLHHGAVLEAFNIPKIIPLLRGFDRNAFLRVVISAVIAQAYTVSALLDFSKGFTLFELFFSVLVFFLAPFLYISAKRLIGLHLRELLQ